jgi:hypothetical protein
MEKKINCKINTFMVKFKTDIKCKIDELRDTDNDIFASLMSYIYDYETIAVCNNDFAKRKRSKNIVPYYERCIASRANLEQCTRRKQSNSSYCGTHIKGTPHGVFDYTCSSANNNVRDNNVYSTEDVLSNKQDITIVCKYVKENDKYSIVDQ